MNFVRDIRGGHDARGSLCVHRTYFDVSYHASTTWMDPADWSRDRASVTRCWPRPSGTVCAG